MCSLKKDFRSMLFPSTKNGRKRMIAHLKRHRQYGHIVPDYAIEGLKYPTLEEVERRLAERRGEK